MKIVNLIGSLGIGGIQVYLLNLSRFDKKNGISRRIITLHNNDGALRNQFLDNDVKIDSCPVIPIDRGWRPYFLWKRIRNFGSIFFIFKLLLKLKKISPDIIIIEEPVKLITQVWVAKFLNIPIIWVIHSERALVKGKNIFKWSYIFFLKHHLNIISDSKYVLYKNIGYLKNNKHIKLDKFPIIHATTDLTKFLSLKINYRSMITSDNNTYIQFGTVGRLNWSKGFDHLIIALGKIKKKTSNFHLKIAGEGPLRNTLQNLIQKNQLESNVKILGEINHNEVSEFLSGLNIYIQPSISEGSPVTLKEAMASGLPILASDAGGIPEIIENNITGFIFQKGNVKKLTTSLLKIMKLDHKKKKKIGLMARNRAKEMYGIDLTSKKLVNIYKKILNER